MSQSFFCPTTGCDEELELRDFAIAITCPECQETFDVDTDAEFVNGSWRDLTKLVLRKPFRGEDPQQ